jgi:hypothetical protein
MAKEKESAGGFKLTDPEAATEDGEKLPFKLYDPVSLSTWARLKSAGKIAKPFEAENMAEDPRRVKPKKRRRK